MAIIAVAIGFGLFYLPILAASMVDIDGMLREARRHA
jgi:hypothetical protein